MYTLLSGNMKYRKDKVSQRRTIMKNRISLFIILSCIITLTAMPVMANEWAIHADYTESCSCNPSCPCVFGSPSTHGFCEGNNLIQVKKGHYGDVDPLCPADS